MIRIVQQYKENWIIQRRKFFFWAEVDPFAVEDQHREIIERDYYDEEYVHASDSMSKHDALFLASLLDVTVSEKISWRRRMVVKLRDLIGIPGPAGMCGPQGDRGLPGESTVTIRRGPTDVQCPHCFKYLSDEPKQRFEMKPAGKLGEFSLFLFTCEKCHKDSDWVAHAGILFPVNSHADWQALPKV